MHFVTNVTDNNSELRLAVFLFNIFVKKVDYIGAYIYTFDAFVLNFKAFGMLLKVTTIHFRRNIIMKKLSLVLLAKAVDGVYDDDPKTNPDAKRFDEISIDEVISRNLQVVDMTASIMVRDNKVPMRVFSLNEENGIVKALSDDFNGTKVTV